MRIRARVVLLLLLGEERRGAAELRAWVGCRGSKRWRGAKQCRRTADTAAALKTRPNNGSNSGLISNTVALATTEGRRPSGPRPAH